MFACLVVLLARTTPAVFSNPEPLHATVAPLTNLASIRRLSSEEAGLRRPVHVCGVVTCDNGLGCLFIQDASAAIFVLRKWPGGPSPLQPGQWIEVGGVSGPGDYAPVILGERARMLGMGKLPTPRPVSFEDLVSGRMDSQWVELRGIVRSVRVNRETGLPEMRLAMGGGFVRVEVKDVPSASFEHLVDATVRVQGAVGGTFNQNRQLVAARLFVPGLNHVLVDEPAPPDPFAVAARPISTLMQYSGQGPYGHRVKVRGAVTCYEAGRRLFIRDATQGLSIQTRQRQGLVPGDIVEVLGFPALGEWMPVLLDAEVRKVGCGALPAPKLVGASQALQGKYDTDLVSLEARLLERVWRPGAEVLVMQANDLIFNAVLETRNHPLLPLRNGSQLRLSGICLVQVAGPTRRREAFQILLRSPADIVVLKNAPWWTVPRILWALGILVIALVLVVSWVVILKRHVRTQTEVIRQKVERQAVLEERTRLAREFHDTLEQELVGITMQLDSAVAKLNRSPQEARPCLGLASQMVRRTLAEARRSVWDLRCHALENGSLVASISHLATPLVAGTAIQVEVREEGPARRLPGLIESNLLRISQEAIANAVKHSHAQRVRIRLWYDADCIRLEIRDDGLGFDPQEAPSASHGHFGLLGMRERAEKMRGTLVLNSGPNGGTEILVAVPTASTRTPAFGGSFYHEQERQNPHPDR